MIASLRTVHGREVAAYSLAHSTPPADGSATTPLWRHPDLQAVRCAGDKARPCFAVIARDEFDQVVSIDPDTGVLGNEILYTGAIEDIAVSTHGDRIHVGDRAPKGIAHIDVHGTVISTTLMFRPLIRSLACSDDRAILVAGTKHTNLYQVGVIEGDSYQMLTETENDILSLVRPSDDGSQVLFLSRTFSPEVIRAAIVAGGFGVPLQEQYGQDRRRRRQRASSGEIPISGAKNAALPLLAAALLPSGASTFKNVPQLADVRTMAKLLRMLGWDGRAATSAR